MSVAIDITPISDKVTSGHKVRGVGMYLSSLIDAMPENKKKDYIFFTRGDELPSSVSIVHYPYFEPFFLTLPVSKQHRTIVTVHDLTPLVLSNLFPVGIKGKLKWLVQKNALKKADAIIVDSVASKKDVIKIVGVPEKKIMVVYLAAGKEYKKITSPHKQIEEVREKYHLPKEFVLYVGDVTPNKNLPRLLCAMEQVSLPLVMIGKTLISEDYDTNNPWNKDLVYVQKRCKDSSNILRLGFVPTEDLVTLYHSATVAVVPSLYEGFGLPVVEAMACGCPVVTTREGSLPEVGGDAVIYVDAYDAANIAEGIQKVIIDEKLQRELSLKGIRQSEKFSWKKAAQETISIYEKYTAK